MMEKGQYKMAGLYNSSKLKVVVLIVSLSISAASIWYTQELVTKLAEREQQQINLFAKGLQAVADPNNDGGISFLFQEIIEANNSIPVILTDEAENPISDKNIDLPQNLTEAQRIQFLKTEIETMKQVQRPILVEPAEGLKNFIFYKNSFLLTQLIYYPYIQLTIIALFAIITFVAYSYSKRSEQNRVWVGLAKETAHQLGTPLSSLIAWIELFREDPDFKNKEVLNELEKDVNRLEMITARFSNIGSTPSLHEEPLHATIAHTVDYLKTRLSKKIKISLTNILPANEMVKINKPLFDWVIENLCKNAVDAMDGSGDIRIHLFPLNENKIGIDVADTGKGMPKSRYNEVFKPGFTTKKRGWGLGLTLVKRIIENYHHGKIAVHQSEVGKGTTFRIVMNRV